MKKIVTILVLFPLSGFAQLTGYWQTENGGCYQITQDGNEVWWAGETPNAQRPTNVFHGFISGNTLVGLWCDMPSSSSQGCRESLSLRLENDNRMVKVASSASYNGNVWTRQNGPCSICPFNASNLPQSFIISVVGSKKHSKCSRIGNSNEYNEELFDGSSKYADRRLRISTNQQNRLVLENIWSGDGWFCTFTANPGDNCAGEFTYKKTGQTGGSGFYTVGSIQQ